MSSVRPEFALYRARDVLIVTFECIKSFDMCFCFSHEYDQHNVEAKADWVK